MSLTPHKKTPIMYYRAGNSGKIDVLKVLGYTTTEACMQTCD